jgi:hypothetical protein
MNWLLGTIIVLVHTVGFLVCWLIQRTQQVRITEAKLADVEEERAEFFGLYRLKEAELHNLRRRYCQTLSHTVPDVEASTELTSDNGGFFFGSNGIVPLRDISDNK